MAYRFAPNGQFQLDQAKRFIEGFDPVDQPVTDEGPLHLAFLSDDWHPAFVSLHQTEHRVVCDVVDGSSDVRDQVERILSLDVDATAFDRLEDPVINALRDRRRGLRPVLFSTPFEAACWSVLTQRTSMTHAANMRHELCTRAGHRFEVGDHSFWTFPNPAAVTRLGALPGATTSQIDRLTSVARAALDGRLDPGTIRRSTGDAALEQLRSITGIGPFGSELIYVRGAGAADHFPRNEPRLRAHMAQLYDLEEPSVDQLAEIADRWAPFRSWASLLIRLDAETTHSKSRHQGETT